MFKTALEFLKLSYSLIVQSTVHPKAVVSTLRGYDSGGGKGLRFPVNGIYLIHSDTGRPG